jgi:hypothetical protein
VNVCVPIHVPDEFTPTERRVFETSFQHLVDLVLELKRSNGNAIHAARDIVLGVHVDGQLVVRGADIDWRAKAKVAV